MKRDLAIILLILGLASVLRFFHLGQNPPSLTWDEAAWGYNAYSLGEYGKDEFGRGLPFDYLESFGDFKPPFYAYASIMPVKLFGLNEFSTRFASAFFGVTAVLFTYFLTRQLFWDYSKKQQLALLSSFLLAISPWHIMLSRAAFEANVASCILIGAVLFFLVAIRGKGIFFMLSIFFFFLSFQTFNTSRVIVPVLILVLSLGFFNTIKKKWRWFFLSGIFGVFLMLPMLPFLFSPQSKLRFREVNIFTDQGVVEIANQEIANNHNAWWSKILNNRRWGYFRLFLQHYFDNFAPKFLFISGDGNPKFSTQDVGELYIWESIFLIFGFLYLLWKKPGYWWFLPIWLVISCVPAGMARETPHALRIEGSLPVWQILVSFGLIYSFSIFHNQRLRILIFGGVILAALGNFIYFQHGYWQHYPKEFSGEWQYGYKEAIGFLDKNSDSYKEVWLSDALGRPYIYLLYYLKVNPKSFWENALISRDAFGFVTINSYEKYHFFSAKNPPLRARGNLYIDVAPSVPGEAKIITSFKLLNGDSSLVAYEI